MAGIEPECRTACKPASEREECEERGCPQPQQLRQFERVRTCLNRLSVRTRCGSGDPRSAGARLSPAAAATTVRAPEP